MKSSIQWKVNEHCQHRPNLGASIITLDASTKNKLIVKRDGKRNVDGIINDCAVRAIPACHIPRSEWTNKKKNNGEDKTMKYMRNVWKYNKSQWLLIWYAYTDTP